jgi:hypothetical protein
LLRNCRYEFYYRDLLRHDVNVVITPPINSTAKGAALELLEVVRQLEEEPQRAQRIAAAAYDTAWNQLSPDAVLRYWHQVCSLPK